MPEWPETPAGRLLRRLEQHYGRQSPAPFRGPFEMILWEIVAYLADDARRATAFAALKERVGLAPEQILAAPIEQLCEITRLGGPIASAERASRLHVAAQLVLDEFGGDLSNVFRLPLPKANKQLMRFPMIGEPGAEKILLFSGHLSVLALESNGLRVLLRAGIGEERGSYAATYRSVREATLVQLPADCGLLVEAHLLLRRHGQQLCVRNGPACAVCPVQADCRHAQLLTQPSKSC